MSLSAAGLSARRAFQGAVVPLFPSLATAPLFLILYNNSCYGRLILVGLILLNLTVFAVPRYHFASTRITSWGRALSSCVMAGLTTMLIIETLFPVMLPMEYSSVLDLSKNFTNHSGDESPGNSTLFDNKDQRLTKGPQNGNNAEGQFKVWHAPGRSFAYYGWDPNSKIQYVNRFQWNSLGYFDHDYRPQKEAGIHRIVLIGDSYVEAIQVPLSSTFHKLLEASLNTAAEQASVGGFEVIALGNSGTGQVTHHKVLRDLAMAYKPDTVIMTLCSNDFCDDDPELKAEFVLSSRSVIHPRFRRLASHGFYALAFAWKRFEDLYKNRISVSPELLQWTREDIPRVDTAWARTLSSIRASRDYCREQGIAFFLVYLGSELEVRYAIDPEITIARLKAMGGPHEYISWDIEKSHRRVAAFCQESDIVLISLLEPLIEAQKSTGQSVFGDHYTMFGHQVAARVLNGSMQARLQTHFAGRWDPRVYSMPSSGDPIARPVVFDPSGRVSK